MNSVLFKESPQEHKEFLHSLPQKITPALKVRAVACTHPTAQTAPTFRLKVSLRFMLSCLLLWLRHSSRQLLCPASSFVQSSFITLHYVPFHSFLFHSAGCSPPAALAGFLIVDNTNLERAHLLPYFPMKSGFRFSKKALTPSL